MEATAHIPFIIAAYTAGIIVVGALIGWVIIDYRIQRRILAELETKGVSRLRRRGGGANDEQGRISERV